MKKDKKSLLSLCMALIMIVSCMFTTITASAWNGGDMPTDFTEPFFDIPVRDTCIQLAPDGFYYMTGTTGDPSIWWKRTDGVRLWKSADMENWEDLGMVFSIEEDGTWAKEFRGENRALWAPEFHYIKSKDNYYITYSMNYGGNGLLVSTTGKPEGPYKDVKDTPMTPGEIDSSLFEDDDGTVYYLWQNGKIAKMNEEMTDFAEEPRMLKPANHHQVGFEGVYVKKIDGKYFLLCAETNNDLNQLTYDCMAASSDSIYGPYSDRYLALRHGGHNMLFNDKDGQLWSSYFGSDPIAPFTERAGALKMQIDSQGKLQAVPQKQLQLDNIAQGKTATASSKWNNDYDAKFAVDGNMKTRWAAANTVSFYGTFPESLTVDLGDIYTVQATQVYFERMKEVYTYYIESSIDGVTWTPFADRKTVDFSGNLIDTGLNYAQYMRITVTGQKSDAPLASLWEFKVFGDKSEITTSELAKNINSIQPIAVSDDAIQFPVVPEGFTAAIKSSSNPDLIALDGSIMLPLVRESVDLVFTITQTSDGSSADTKTISVSVPGGGVNLSKNKPASASSIHSAPYTAAKAFDGKMDTRWAAIGPAMPQWLKVDLGDVYDIAAIETYFEFATHYMQYEMQYSLDGVIWSTYADRTDRYDIENPYLDQKEVPAKYVRINVTKAQKENMDFASVWEMNVIGNGNLSTYAAPLGDGSVPLSIAPSESAELSFNRALSENGKQSVESALGNSFSFDWNETSLTITNTSDADQVFYNGITADIEDSFGVVSKNVTLIYADQTAPYATSFTSVERELIIDENSNVQISFNEELSEQGKADIELALSSASSSSVLFSWDKAVLTVSKDTENAVIAKDIYADLTDLAGNVNKNALILSVASGNPVLPGYFADPSVLYYEGVYYVYATTDGYDWAAGPMVAWKSTDLVNWTMSGTIHSNVKSWNWAPSVVQKDGKFYIYHTVNGAIFVGVADSPEGPFVNPLADDAPLIVARGFGTDTIDSEVYIDDDGKAYLYFGNGKLKAVQLNDDMISFEGSKVIDLTPPDYVEAPFMIKENGKYYLTWSNYGFQDPRYEVRYAVGDNPLGPFTYDKAQNPILSLDPSKNIQATGHHSMLKPEGSDQWYIIYHRHEIPFVDGIFRQTAIDKVNFDEDGKMLKVIPTHEGIEPLHPSTETLKNIALNKSYTASSQKSDTFAPSKAFDNGYATRWTAANSTEPQWLTVDLGEVMDVEKVETRFEYPTKQYKYTLDTSIDGIKWDSYADRTTDTVMECPKVDTKSVKAKYVRITIDGTSPVTLPSIWEFKVFGQPKTVDTSFDVVIDDVANVEGKTGTTFNMPVKLSAFPTDAEYKSIEGVVTLPQGVTVTDAKAALGISASEFKWYVDTNNTLRFAFVSMDKNSLAFTGQELLTLTMALTADQTAGSVLPITFTRFAAKNSQSVFDFSLAKATANLTIAEETEQELTASARELYQGDGIDLIAIDQKAVAIELGGLTKANVVSFDEIELLYSPELTEKAGKSDRFTYVALVSTDLSIEALNDATRYTATEADAQSILFGDTDASTELDAQDALNILYAWLRKNVEPLTSTDILMYNMNADRRIDTSDAIAVVDAYVGSKDLAVLTK